MIRIAPIYRNGSRSCQLCIHEKTAIALCPPRTLLNSRTELLNKCIHRSQFELAKVKIAPQYRGALFIYSYLLFFYVNEQEKSGQAGAELCQAQHSLS